MINNIIVHYLTRFKKDNITAHQCFLEKHLCCKIIEKEVKHGENFIFK